MSSGEPLAMLLHREYTKHKATAQAYAGEPAAQEIRAQEIRAAVIRAAQLNVASGEACAKFTRYSNLDWSLAAEHLRNKDGFNTIWFNLVDDKEKFLCVRFSSAPK
jgi:hypothetical protein